MHVLFPLIMYYPIIEINNSFLMITDLIKMSCSLWFNVLYKVVGHGLLIYG